MKELCQNFLDVTYVKGTDAWDIDVHDENKYLPTNHIYLGVSASDSISELPEAAKQVVYEGCRNFYIELIFQLRKRFQFDDEVYSHLSVLDNQNALYLKTPSLRQVYGHFVQIFVNWTNQNYKFNHGQPPQINLHLFLGCPDLLLK